MFLSHDWTDRAACALCTGGRLRTERQIDVFPLQRCGDCGFLQTGRVLHAEALGQLYAEGYGGKRHQQGQEINAGINALALDQMGLGQSGGGPLRLLDVGCGYGYFLDRMRRPGARVAGVELARAEADFARDVLKLDIAGSVAELPPFLRTDFDMVTLFEVIEHIENPVAFLREMTGLLSPGGVLVLATDNFASWPARVLADGFPKWIPHQHISLFDPASLEALVRSVGNIEIVARISYTPWELLLRAGLHWLTGGRLGARRYRLEDELIAENARPYRFHALRRTINKIWFELASTRNLNGEMMFVAIQKVGT